MEQKNLTDIATQNEEEHEAQEEKLRATKVAEMARLGISEKAIAAMVGLDEQGLETRYGQIISGIKTKMNEGVLETFYKMASSGKNLSATLFWLKMHCSHLLPEMEPKDDSAKSKSAKKEYVWDPNDPNDRVRFTVYNNDGEPNADY